MIGFRRHERVGAFDSQYERPSELEFEVKGILISDPDDRMTTMVIPAWNCIQVNATIIDPVIIFAPTIEQTTLTAKCFVKFAERTGTPNMFLGSENYPPKIQQLLSSISNKDLRVLVTKGLAYLHNDVSFDDRRAIEKLFDFGIIQILIVTQNLAWELTVGCHLAIMMDMCLGGVSPSEYFYGSPECSVQDIMQMISFANRTSDNENPKCTIYCHESMRNIYEQILMIG